MKRTACYLFAIGLVLLARSLADASVLYGSKNSLSFQSDGIYTIDQSNGALTKLGGDNVSWSDMSSDWRPGSFRLWALQGVQDKLFEVNSVTGSYLLVKQAINMPADIAFDITTGTLYGDLGNTLYDVNLGGSGVVAVATLQRTLNGLAFDSAGVLYASDDDGNLVTVNKATGAVATVGSTGVGAMADLAFRPEDGVLFGAGSTADTNIRAIYRLDVSTGAASLVGTYPSPSGGSSAISGLAFSPAPEPSASLLAVLAMPVLLGRWRAR